MENELNIGGLEFGESSFGQPAPGKKLDICHDCGIPFEPIGENVAVEIRCISCQVRWRLSLTPQEIEFQKNNRTGRGEHWGF